MIIIKLSNKIVKVIKNIHKKYKIITKRNLKISMQGIKDSKQIKLFKLVILSKNYLNIMV